VSAAPVPADPILAALDVGSSSVRALAFDRRGGSLDVGVQRPYEPTTTPDGGVEIDADRLVELTAETLDGLVAALGGRIERLAGVATSTFWHTVLGLGPDDRPSTPVYSWADTRSAGAVDELRARVDEKAYHARVGCRPGSRCRRRNAGDASDHGRELRDRATVDSNSVQIADPVRIRDERN